MNNTIVSKVLLHGLVQNNDGSFGAYELTRSYEWLEVSFAEKCTRKYFNSMFEEETVVLIYHIKSIYNSS